MKKIAYITGSRAEYGIVKRLLKKLQDDESLAFSLIVTAMHLSEQYGNTYQVIESDGIKITEKIPIHLDNSNNQTIVSSMAECLDKFGVHFQKNKYDAVIILGDRYEMLSVATAAAMHNIPIIHLHGGEQTLGNYDEFIRHNITKMAKLHLTATETYRQRVIQLGEPPQSVVNIGSLGAENGLLLNLPNKEELQKTFHLNKNYFVVVFHPETLNNFPVTEQVNELLQAIDEYKFDYDFVFIGSNSDTNADVIVKMVNNYAQNNNFGFYSSVTPENYLALIKHSVGIIGNSSSGLIEAPTFKVGTLNIGNRQQGRVRGQSVIDVPTNKLAIENGIHKMLSYGFQQMLKNTENPYYKGNCLEKAYQAIIEFVNKENQQPKVFFDLENGNK